MLFNQVFKLAHKIKANVIDKDMLLNINLILNIKLKKIVVDYM